jgi:hypothetical protein
LSGVSIDELRGIRDRGGTVVFVSTACSGVLEAGIICEFLFARHQIDAIVDLVFLEPFGKGTLARGVDAPGPLLVIPHDDQIVGSGASPAAAAKTALDRYPAACVHRGNAAIREEFGKHY